VLGLSRSKSARSGETLKAAKTITLTKIKTHVAVLFRRVATSLYLVLS
jgi:hypothetical protein